MVTGRRWNRNARGKCVHRRVLLLFWGLGDESKYVSQGEGTSGKEKIKDVRQRGDD